MGCAEPYKPSSALGRSVVALLLTLTCVPPTVLAASDRPEARRSSLDPATQATSVLAGVMLHRASRTTSQRERERESQLPFLFRAD